MLTLFVALTLAAERVVFDTGVVKTFIDLDTCYILKPESKFTTNYAKLTRVDGHLRWAIGESCSKLDVEKSQEPTLYGTLPVDLNGRFSSFDFQVDNYALNKQDKCEHDGQDGARVPVSYIVGGACFAVNGKYVKVTTNVNETKTYQLFRDDKCKNAEGEATEIVFSEYDDASCVHGVRFTALDNLCNSQCIGCDLGKPDGCIECAEGYAHDLLTEGLPCVLDVDESSTESSEKHSSGVGASMVLLFPLLLVFVSLFI